MRLYADSPVNDLVLFEQDKKKLLKMIVFING